MSDNSCHCRASNTDFAVIRLVDLEKLRDYARHGVQPGVRGEVWLYLLGVLSADKSEYHELAFSSTFH